MYIVVTTPHFWPGEAEAITMLFQSGLQRLHLRKPGHSSAECQALLDKIPTCYHERIVMGKITSDKTCSCHSIQELTEQKANPAYEYLTLSPIYDSISKEGYRAAFSREELVAAREAGIIDSRVVALGGICRDNIAETLQMGFGGVMVLGDAWHGIETDETNLPVVLSIAGSDPSAGAGIQQDLKTMTNHQCYGATVITSLTTQNTQGVQSQMPVPADVVESQLRAVMDDLRVEAVKIGIIPTIDIARAIVRVLREEKAKYVLPVIYDPVMVSSSGHSLMDEDCVRYMVEELFPLCTLVTPNIPETDVIRRVMGLEADMPWPCNMLIKGGHAESDMMTDRLWLVDEQREVSFSSPRIHSTNLHGTGCTLSSAIACCMAKKQSLATAVGNAKDYISQAIEQGSRLHVGHGNGPLWWTKQE